MVSSPALIVREMWMALMDIDIWTFFFIGIFNWFFAASRFGRSFWLDFHLTHSRI